MDEARKAAKRILGAYPDYGKAPPEYILSFAEALSYLTPEELAVVMHPKTGVSTRCTFLPTIADIHAVLREHHERAEKFKPAHTIYKRFTEEPGPWDRETDFERKRLVVRECLGYNPGERADPEKREFTVPDDETVRNLKLKTPPAPPSPYLVALLKEQGWPFIPDGNAA